MLFHEVQIWSAYVSDPCPHTNPRKRKYVVIACKHNERAYGFLINSAIGPFLLKRPDNLACQVTLKATDHRFLHKQSYLDCSQLFPFYLNEINARMGALTQATVDDIINIVRSTKLIERRFQKMILANGAV